MLPVRWKADAYADLAAILDYVAKRSPQAALDLYKQIDRLVSQLPQHPDLYRPGRVAGTRELVVHPNYIRISYSCAND
jgi:toxin ParE1/3/4